LELNAAVATRRNGHPGVGPIPDETGGVADVPARNGREGRFVRVERELPAPLAQGAPVRRMHLPLPGQRDHPLRPRGVTSVAEPLRGELRENDTIDVKPNAATTARTDRPGAGLGGGGAERASHQQTS
jgi:hypothetical protein